MIILFLLLASFVLAEKVIPLPEVLNPNPAFYPLSVNDNNIYITDGLSILIYSQKDFKLKKRFGKQGEGPQEFMGYDMQKTVFTSIDSQYIAVDSNGKLSYYSLDGEYLKEIKIVSGRGVKILDDKFVLYGYDRTGKNIDGSVLICNSDLKQSIPVMHFPEFMDNEMIDPLKFRRPQPVIYDHKLFINELEDGVIKVYDKNGKKLYSTEYNYQKLGVTQELKDEILNIFITDPRIKENAQYILPRIRFSKYCPILKGFGVSEKKIYALTWVRSADKKNSEIIIFNINGKFIKKVMFPVFNSNSLEPFPYFFFKDKFYQVVENQDTDIWELHITDIK